MKKITRLFLSLALTFFAGSSYAQFTKVWTAQYQHTTGPGFSNESRRVAEDPNGNIFVLADVSSDIDPLGLHTMNTYHYVVINKYSTNGLLLNTTSLNIQKHITNGFYNQSAFGLEVDASGNVYAGYTSWSANTAHDIVLSKFDNTLTRIWSNFYSTPGLDVGIEMKLHPSGTLYALIKSVGGTTDYSLIKSVPSNNPALLVLTYPGGGNVLNSLALDGASKAYVAGYSIKGGYKNALVASINVVTNLVVWSSNYTPMGIIGDDVANKITVGSDGNVYTVGTSYQGVNFGDEAFVLKNLPGTAKFNFVAVLHNPTFNDKGLFIDAVESGWLYVGAVSSGFQTIIYRIPNNGVFVSPSKIIFNPTPSASFTSITEVTLSAMKVSSNKNIYFAGSISATGPSGNFSSCYMNKASVVFGNALVRMGGPAVEGDFNNNMESVDLSLDYGKSDVYWLRNFWDDTHTQEKVDLVDVSVPSPFREMQENGITNGGVFTMSPNPAIDQVNIQSSDAVLSIELLDMTGKRVMFSAAKSANPILDVSSLSSGIYLCRVITASGQQVKKLVIN